MRRKLKNNSNTAKNTVDLSVNNKSSSPEAKEENRSPAVKNKEGVEEEIQGKDKEDSKRDGKEGKFTTVNTSKV